MNPRNPIVPALFACVALLLPSACKKVIGDACAANSECSISNDRTCDLSQPGGYCTVIACEPSTCPDNGVCVYFDAHAPRLRRRYCMAGCNDSSDCRDGFQCVSPDPLACLDNTTAVLPPGQSCNRIADPTPQFPGWCVQAR